MTCVLSFASATSILPIQQLSSAGIQAVHHQPIPSVEQIKQSRPPQRKFFIEKHVKPSNKQQPINRPVTSIRRQSGHSYRNGSLFEALVEIVWLHITNNQSTNVPINQPERDAFVEQLNENDRDTFVQTFNQCVEASIQSINQFFVYLEQTTIARPWQLDYQSIDQINNQTINQILSEPCDLSSILSPLLYELGFIRQSINVFRLVQSNSHLQGKIKDIRQQLIDQMDEGFEFDSNKADDENDEDVCQTTHAFDVLTLDHASQSSEDEGSDHRRTSISDSNASRSRSPRSTSRVRSAHKPVRSMPRKPTDVVHDRHTFVSKPGNNQPKKPVQAFPLPSQSTNQTDSPVIYSSSLLVDVAGFKRQNPVTLPSTFISSAAAQPNESYIAAELSGQARPVIKTSSTAKQTLNQATIPFTTFTLQPSLIEFGLVEQGHVYRAQLALTNVGVVKGRFAVREVPQSGDFSVRVYCRPGLLAPGLQKRIEIELEPHVLENVDEKEIDTCLEVATEAAILRVPIHAQSIRPALFAQKVSEARQLGAPVSSRVTQETVGFFKSSGLIGPLKKVKSNIGAIRQVPKPQSEYQSAALAPKRDQLVGEENEIKEQTGSIMNEDWTM